MPEEEKVQPVVPAVSNGQQVTTSPASGVPASGSLASGDAPSGLLRNQEELLQQVQDLNNSLYEELSRDGVERISCDAPGCQWFRPINATISSAQALELYRLHLSAGHNKTPPELGSQNTLELMSHTLARLVEQGSSNCLQSAKLESAPRPTCY